MRPIVLDIDEQAELRKLREDLLRIPPPYLLRKYEATEEEYDRISDEDLRCELIDGVLIVHSPASPIHEERIVFLAVLLGSFVASRRAGRVYGPNAVMQLGQRRLCADLLFLAAANLNRQGAKRIAGPMDLAIEVLSSSTRAYDLGEKRQVYRDGRVPELWLLDPDRRQAHMDYLQDEQYKTSTLSSGWLTSLVLPGFAINFDWLSAEPLPNPLDCLEAMKSR